MNPSFSRNASFLYRKLIKQINSLHESMPAKNPIMAVLCQSQSGCGLIKLENTSICQQNRSEHRKK